MPELTAEMKRVKEEGCEAAKVVEYCNSNMCVKIKPEELANVAALKVAMKNLAGKYGCNAIAIQCWNALQGEIGIMPCAANSLLNEEGFRWCVRRIFMGRLPLFWWRLREWMRTGAFSRTGR